MLYPLLTSFVVVATANHYVIDVLAGALAFGLAVAMLPRPCLAAAGQPEPAMAEASGSPSRSPA